MINVLIAENFLDQVEEQTLVNAANAALRQSSETPESDLTVVIEDDAYLHDLNKKFLGIDAPTDVLSFPSGEGEVDPETGQPYLGDVIISLPRASEQAAAAGHEVRDELQLLVVHGVLHLLGHDHAEPEEKERMWAAQTQALNELGVHLSRLPE